MVKRNKNGYTSSFVKSSSGGRKKLGADGNPMPRPAGCPRGGDVV